MSGIKKLAEVRHAAWRDARRAAQRRRGVARGQPAQFLRGCVYRRFGCCADARRCSRLVRGSQTAAPTVFSRLRALVGPWTVRLTPLPRRVSRCAAL
jgi:hypothetical protein